MSDERSASTPEPTSTRESWLRAWITLAAVAAIGAAIDLVSKTIAFRTIADDPVTLTRKDVLATTPARIGELVPQHDPVTSVPYLLEFQLVLNPGAVFGVGAGKRLFFVLFTAIAAAVALWMFRAWTRPKDWLAHTALGLVLAGGIGNLYDRLLYACVRDFLHPLPNVHLPFGITWPGGDTEVWPWVSNIADALLLIGIGILMVKLWRDDSRAKAEETRK